MFQLKFQLSETSCNTRPAFHFLQQPSFESFDAESYFHFQSVETPAWNGEFL